jgi:hypothetical protein
VQAWRKVASLITLVVTWLGIIIGTGIMMLMHRPCMRLLGALFVFSWP